TIENIASRILVYSVQGVDLKPPSLSVDVPVLLGPFGDPVGRKMVLTMPRRHKANGIAIYKNKSWRWLGGVDDFEDPGDFLAVSLPYLAPVVLVRDVTAPTARIVRGAGPYKVTAVKFSDNFSGIARESVTVESVTAESADVIIQGRYDSDRKTYLPDADFKPGKYKLRVRAMDNAGNKLNTTLTFQQK
ncbi:MAG: hypothetical protein JKX97_01175, partial [Candidatus Lindowbacteria bacterium]|nr:hypothetical protein [Candidatus Lindowbacteria bacterium]